MSGIEKHIDELGRVVLPVKMRNKLNLTNHSMVIVTLDGDTILITPKECSCALCGAGNIESSGVRLCKACIEKIKAL